MFRKYFCKEIFERSYNNKNKIIAYIYADS